MKKNKKIIWVIEISHKCASLERVLEGDRNLNHSWASPISSLALNSDIRLFHSSNEGLFR